MFCICTFCVFTLCGRIGYTTTLIEYPVQLDILGHLLGHLDNVQHFTTVNDFKGACSEIWENEFSLNLQIWSLFKPLHHPWWKNCKFLSPWKVIIGNQYLFYLLFYKLVETTFSNFREGFSLISSELHRVCAWNFTHTYRLLNMTQLLVSKSPRVWKKVGEGGWGCGSE